MLTHSRFVLWAMMFALTTMGAPAVSFGELPTIQADLTQAPAVPPPLSRSTPARVVVHFEAQEFVGPLSDDKSYKFWSFNGTVPGPMIRVRVGDTVEFHLKNHHKSQFPHNIDIHAVNGPGGGAAVNLVSPGQKSAFTFKVLNPGLYIYHCASPVPNIPAHIANGMYGLILVEPTGGLPKVNREYYVLQSEFFTKPSKDPQVLELSMDKGLSEHPDFVVFNGRQGGVMGNGALQARVGDTVRIYFGNIGPNSTSSFHVIGEIFDTVYIEGAIGGQLNHNVQTTLVPSAGAVIVEMKIEVPGDYLLVDHSIFRVAKGAIGFLTATGEDRPEIFQGLPQP